MREWSVSQTQLIRGYVALFSMLFHRFSYDKRGIHCSLISYIYVQQTFKTVYPHIINYIYKCLELCIWAYINVKMQFYFISPFFILYVTYVYVYIYIYIVRNNIQVLYIPSTLQYPINKNTIIYSLLLIFMNIFQS